MRPEADTQADRGGQSVSLRLAARRALTNLRGRRVSGIAVFEPDLVSLEFAPVHCLIRGGKPLRRGAASLFFWFLDIDLRAPDARPGAGAERMRMLVGRRLECARMGRGEALDLVFEDALRLRLRRKNPLGEWNAARHPDWPRGWEDLAGPQFSQRCR